MFSKVRDRFFPLWPFMGPLDKARAIWYFYRWQAMEHICIWLHKNCDRLRAGKDGRNG
jgi:hypothetical protein